MKFFLACAFVLAAVGTVTPTPKGKVKFCCFPQQYEASVGGVSGYALPNGKGEFLNSFSHLAVDNKNERAAEDRTQTVNGKTTKLRILINYREKVKYVIQGETCIKSAMNTPQLKCIPDNAIFVGSSYFGDKQLAINSYNFPLKQIGIFEGNASITVTKDKCVFVSSVLIGHTMASPAPALPVIMNTGDVNFTSGIRDPTHWFTPPSFCPREVSEVSARAVDSYPGTEFMTLGNVIMESMVDE